MLESFQAIATERAMLPPAWEPQPSRGSVTPPVHREEAGNQQSPALQRNLCTGHVYK